jgi:thiamine phosphate synthase YjbQ (UPF0047 family)
MHETITLVTRTRETLLDITPQVKNVFFCEFDGPRSDRRACCTVLGAAV